MQISPLCQAQGGAPGITQSTKPTQPGCATEFEVLEDRPEHDGEQGRDEEPLRRPEDEIQNRGNQRECGKDAKLHQGRVSVEVQ